MYYNGDGTSKDLKEAIYWYAKSAEQGTSEAQSNIGIMYYNGEGTSKDLKKAAHWLKKAYEKGNDRAGDLLTDWELWGY